MALTLENVNLWHGLKIWGLFRRAFPPEERPPFRSLLWRARNGRAEWLCAVDEGKFVGFAYLVNGGDLAYLLFFAIHENCRNQGYGSRILELLREKHPGKRIFLTREALDPSADNYDQRVWRRKFYLRNGFVDLPCKIKEGDVVYETMSTGGSFSVEEYDALISAWMGRAYGRVEMRMLGEGERA